MGKVCIHTSIRYHEVSQNYVPVADVYVSKVHSKGVLVHVSDGAYSYAICECLKASKVMHLSLQAAVFSHPFVAK